MPLFKKKLHLEAAMRLALSAALRRDHHAALADIAAAGALEQADLPRMEQELPAFEVALWHLLFLQHAEFLGAQELTKRFTIALALAYRDSGLRPDNVDQLLASTMETALSYLEGLDSVDPDHLKEAGPAYGYCQQFTARVLPAIDLRGEAGRDRHLQVFDIAKQAFTSTELAFNAILKGNRVSVS
jgi:hypothetical protein